MYNYTKIVKLDCKTVFFVERQDCIDA